MAAAAACRQFSRVRPRVAIHQRQPQYPLRRLPHDLQRDVAAHRMSGQRKTRRRLIENSLRDAAHAVVADVVGHHDRANPP
jgi:hypothetical protein